MPVVGLWLKLLAVVDGGLLTAHVLGQTASTPESVDVIVTLANYGTVGVLAVLLLTGRMVGKSVYDQALKDRDRDHGELVALRQKLEDVIIPGFVRMTDLTQRLLDRERDERRSS